MTIKQALIATISIQGVDNNLIEKALVDNDLNGSENYSKSVKSKVEIAAIGALFSAMHTANVSEGGFSVSFNYEAAKQTIVCLANEYPDELISKKALEIYGPKNKIRSSSRW